MVTSPGRYLDSWCVGVHGSFTFSGL